MEECSTAWFSLLSSARPTRGICHGDAIVKSGHFPGITYPRIPGHEVVGTIERIGESVDGWKPGQRVGVGWHGGHCSSGEHPTVTGITVDGGYAEYMTACADRTTFGALQNSGARAGDLVAVLGVGGLGHLGIQYAQRMGFRTVAISRGENKRSLAMKLGAETYIDAAEGDVAQRLMSLGGAKVVLCTAPSGRAISEIVGGLGRGGQAVVVSAAADPITIPPGLLLGGGRSIKGSVEGDVEEALRFSLMSGVKPMVETFPLEQSLRPDRNSHRVHINRPFPCAPV